MIFICQKCRKEFERYIRPSHIKRGRGKFCSRKCFHQTHRELYHGKNHWSWKDNLTYGSLHDWLHKKFGSANKCENSNCLRKSITYQYALIKGKNYERKRGNFIMLCRACHYKYDDCKFGGMLKGKHLSSITKKKLSKSIKLWWKIRKQNDLH